MLELLICYICTRIVYLNYNSDGKGYIIQCDSIGNMYLLDGITGKILDKINLGSNIESSPAVFEDYIVVGTRGGSKLDSTPVPLS